MVVVVIVIVVDEVGVDDEDHHLIVVGELGGEDEPGEENGRPGENRPGGAVRNLVIIGYYKKLSRSLAAEPGGEGRRRCLTGLCLQPLHDHCGQSRLTSQEQH